MKKNLLSVLGQALRCLAPSVRILTLTGKDREMVEQWLLATLTIPLLRSLHFVETAGGRRIIACFAPHGEGQFLLTKKGLPVKEQDSRYSRSWLRLSPELENFCRKHGFRPGVLELPEGNLPLMVNGKYVLISSPPARPAQTVGEQKREEEQVIQLASRFAGWLGLSATPITI